MNRDPLTLLGCCGSLAFMLLTANAASAGTVSPQYAGFVGSAKTSTPTATASSSQEFSQGVSINAASDKIGDLAIAKFGCDCMSCRNAVVQMVQSGQLSLPQ